jgi:hypothetical protein
VQVHLAAEHALEFELAHLRLERAGVAFDVARRGFVVLALGQLEQLARVADGGVGAIELLELRAQARAFAPEFLRPVRCAPDLRVLQFARDFLEPLLLAVVLKETPSRRRRAPRDLSTCA